MESFMLKIYEKAKADPKRIVFPESFEERILGAVQKVKYEGFAKPILVGNREEILSKHAGGMVLWVGNKSPVGIWGGNLKEIYLRLGGKGDSPAKYDDLFFITVPDHGDVKVEKTTYGKSAGSFDQ